MTGISASPSPNVAAIRARAWTVAPIPAALQDRRVEITGPVDPKMVINALNSGANCYMADFEDSTSPTWANLLEGQRALRKAVAAISLPTWAEICDKSNPGCSAAWRATAGKAVGIQ